MDCSLPGSSVHEIFQARILEWVAISFSRGFSQLSHRTRVSRIVGRCFTLWATLLTKSYVFSSSHVWVWELDHKEGWVLNNWWFWTLVLEKTFESPLDSKEIQPVHPKGNKPYMFIGRTDAEGKAPVLWLPDVKSQLTGKDPDAGKGWRQEEKGMTEDEMVG